MTYMYIYFLVDYTQSMNLPESIDTKLRLGLGQRTTLGFDSTMVAKNE